MTDVSGKVVIQYFADWKKQIIAFVTSKVPSSSKFSLWWFAKSSLHQNEADVPERSSNTSLSVCL